MKIDETSISTMAPKTSSPNSLLKQQTPNNKCHKQYSITNGNQRRNQNMSYQRRQTMGVGNNDFLKQHDPSAAYVPLLADAMNEFFQATKIMEDEIMLPSRLKDMPVDEVIFDNAVQPNNWHDFYTFIRDTRNQLTRSCPFSDNDKISHTQEIKDSNDDEGILLATSDKNQQQPSSSTSSISSDELEQSTGSSNAASFDTIKDELKHYFFGLVGSLDNLKLMANRVTEKYREGSAFKN